MTKSQTQNGSSQIIFIIIVALAILTVLGFVLWQNFLKPVDVADQKPVVENSTEIAAADVEDWTRYAPEGYGYSIPIPDGWKVQEFTDPQGGTSAILIQKEGVSIAEALTYKKGTPATIDKVSNDGRGYTSHFSVTPTNDGSQFLDNEEFERVSTFKTNDGAPVNKLQKIYETESGGVGASYPAGTKVYGYLIDAGDFLVQVMYQLNPEGQADNTAQLELAIKAIELK